MAAVPKISASRKLETRRRERTLVSLVDELEAMLRKMGYTEKDLPASVVRRNDDEEDTWREFYESIVKTPDFRARLSRLPTFGNGAREIPVPTCRPHEIVRDSRCCSDFDDDKICDDAQTGTRGVTSADLKFGFVKDSPPALLCGNDPLRIAVRVSNVSQGNTIPKGAMSRVPLKVDCGSGPTFTRPSPWCPASSC
jgi:hypothetical protein